ncbi:c-type cytochrome [Halarcobacter ebronensis]|uniref:p-cresol methylhydroxylase n=1 Tax=Halarcobacter ebronensis TaxID=1462615 RepID=A0A4Q1AW05_9BACT|nr:cytochrome c [Halarcobacter ebronensis]QKF81045.1 cytochrome c [Halarcobacter ebronensis]RXK06354.1 p-cresol methylhydroxylase [Halarcobacter ebronensis]
MLRNIYKILLLLLLASATVYASDSSKFDQGKKVFDKWCIHCHGVGMPATDALKIVYKGTDISPVLEERKELDADFVKYIVRNGKFSMPFFRKTEINDEQLNSLALYLSTKNK